MTDPNMLLCCEAPAETNVDSGDATVPLKQPPQPPPAQSLFVSWLGDPQVNAAPPPPPPAAAAEDPAASPAAPVALPDLPTMPIFSLGGEPAPPLSVPKRAVGANGKKGARPNFTNTTQMKLFYMDGLEVHHSRAPSRVRSCSSPPV